MSIHPWKTLASKIIHTNPWYRLRQDQVQTHTNAEITYTYMDHPGSVAIVPVTNDDQIVLIRQYRYTVRDWCLEIPIGGKDDPDSLIVARKELLEEIGGIATDIRPIAKFYPSNGTSNGQCEVFLATGVELGKNQPEATELIEILPKPKSEVLQLVRSGLITDGLAALSIFLCEPHW
jgi:8-oxo-dGTP pyrophosphatase MutT (NUDIX family)